MKMFKKLLCVVLCFSLVFGVGLVLNTKNVEAKKKINHKSITVRVGKERTLKLYVKDAWLYTWKRSNKRVKIDDCGKYCYVTGVRPGKCTLTAKYGKKKIKCKVTVRGNVTISLDQSLPIYVREYASNGKVRQRIKITGVWYRTEFHSYDNKATVTLLISGMKDMGSTTVSDNAWISYKLYRSNGSVFSDDSFLTPSLTKGERFEDVEELVFDVPPGHYTLKILSTLG